MKTTLSIVLFASLVLFAAGCAKAPQAEMDAAQAAITAAETAEANLYVSDLYQAAQDSFAAAQAEIELQNAKSTFSRDYDRAAALLTFASQTAAEAEGQVELRKEAMRVETEQLIAQADSAVQQVETLIAQAPRGKDGAVALVSIQEDAATAVETLGQARTAQAEGAYAQAHDLAQAAFDQAAALVEELNAAIAKTQPAPRS